MLSSTFPPPRPEFPCCSFEVASTKLQQMDPEICVTTRHAWKVQMKREKEATTSQAHLSPPTPVSAETSPETDEPNHLAGPSKRPRISLVPEPTLRPSKPSKRANACRSRASSSRAQSRQRSETLDIEPIYRSSRSRSTSVFPPALRRRQLWISEDGSPGENFVSAASVIKTLSRSYKTCEHSCVLCGHLIRFILIADFKNLDDPSDTSFEAESYPTTELEYPNAHACETCVLYGVLYFLLIHVVYSYCLLAPKDPDHYNPIMCLEQSLYTIFECMLLPLPPASADLICNTRLPYTHAASAIWNITHRFSTRCRYDATLLTAHTRFRYVKSL